MRYLHPLVLLALLTSSFDLVLVFNVGGTLRLAQLLLVVFVLAAMGWIIQQKRLLWPRGGYAMALYLVIQAVLVLQWHGIVLLLSAQTFLLLSLTIVGIFAVLQLYGDSGYVEKLMRGYLVSFVAIAGFGLFQWASPALHLGHWFVVQWIWYGELPRLNGLNYEPSYFATYMIMGFIMLVDLRVTRAKLTAGRRWFWATVLVAVVFFLSTSKTAWLFLVLEGALRARPYVTRALEIHVVRFRKGHLLLSLPRVRFVVVTLVLAVGAVAGLYGVSRVVPLNTFLAGTGLAGTASHSLNDRTTRAGDTWHVFLNHPVIGLGIGGVASGVAELTGEEVVNFDTQRSFQGYPVPLEALAAGGLLGFAPFLWFFLVITIGETRLMRERWADDRAKWLHALIRAMAFEWLCLLGDQFMLRVYLWFHVTMLVVVGYNLRYGKAAARRETALPARLPGSTPGVALTPALTQGMVEG